MTNPSALSFNGSIDLQASAARRAAARRLAAEQADVVACCKGGASQASIDLLFLLQESVLVFDETHAMLAALAAVEQEPRPAQEPVRAHRDVARRPRSPLLVAAHAVAFLAAVAAAAMLIEVVDPAPLEVQAVGFGAALPGP